MWFVFPHSTLISVFRRGTGSSKGAIMFIRKCCLPVFLSCIYFSCLSPAIRNGLVGTLFIILISSKKELSFPKKAKILSNESFLNIAEKISFPSSLLEIITSNNVRSYHWNILSRKVICGLGKSPFRNLFTISLVFF